MQSSASRAWRHTVGSRLAPTLGLMKHTVAVALLALFATAVAAQSSKPPCTRDEGLAAEVVTDYLSTWDNVYRFYKQFGHCYDGAIAEGAQDRIQLLWARSWSELPRMLAFTSKDPGFKKFVWAIIDSEAFPQGTFNIVLKNASTRCPAVAIEFCQAVKSSAKLPR